MDMIEEIAGEETADHSKYVWKLRVALPGK